MFGFGVWISVFLLLNVCVWVVNCYSCINGLNNFGVVVDVFDLVNYFSSWLVVDFSRLLNVVFSWCLFFVWLMIFFNCFCSCLIVFFIVDDEMDCLICISWVLDRLVLNILWVWFGKLWVLFMSRFMYLFCLVRYFCNWVWGLKM